MTLPDGQYSLKASPIVPAYASNNGLDEIVTVESNPLTVQRRQIWKIAAIKGKPDAYAIYFVTFVGREGWALKNDPNVPLGPVISSIERIGEWHIDHLNNGHPYSYAIRPVTKAVGAAYYATTNNENQVIVKAFPITDKDVPSWQIQPHH